jgi:hypothetical protein
VPEEENSARVVVAAAGRMPADWKVHDFYDLLKKVSPPVRLARPNYEALRNGLEELGPQLAEARKLADLPRGRHRTRYVVTTDLPGTSATDQEKTRRVATLLGYGALRRTEEGGAAGALADCRAIVNAGRSIGDEPETLSQLYRVMAVSLACTVAQRMLAQTEPPDADLAALQRLLEDEDAFPGLLVSLRADRAWLHDTFTKVQSGIVTPTRGESFPGLAGRFVYAYRRSRLRADHPPALSLLTRYIEAARLPESEQPAAVAALDAETLALRRPDAEDFASFDSGSRLVRSFRRTHACLRSMIVCLAAERYRRAHGRWPEAPADLVPGQLAAVPVDPFDARPLRYRRLADGIVVYSVGQDGADNGGTFDEEAPSRAGTDVGYRLWDPDWRRQPPQAAAGRAGEGGSP